MNTHLDSPPAMNTRSRIDASPARNTRSRTRRSRTTRYPAATARNTRSRTTRYPVAKPELNNGRTNTPHHETVATPLFWGRSVLPSQTVSEKQLMALIRSDGLSNDISYKVHGSARISNCPGLKFLSGNISVEKCLFINECPELRTISANLFVGGDLYIRACPLLESIAGSVTVNCTMVMPHCQSLVDLPGIFSVGGSLHLMCCNRLRDLSGSFSVQDSALFCHCRRLRDLSGNINVGDTLDLSYCNRLTNLSGTFSVGRYIDLNHCTRLRVVPDSITALGSGKSRVPLTIDLEFTGLSDATIGQLHSARINGMHFETTNEKKKQLLKEFNNLQEGLAFWRDLACSNKDTPQLNLQRDQAEDVLDFLEQLTWTREYQDEKYRPVLAQRVIKVITLVLMDDHLQEEALTHIIKGIGSTDELICISLEPLEDMLKGCRLQSSYEYQTGQLPINSA